MSAFDDETLDKLEKKLIAAGYTDGEWRSIMFKYYGEDYEGMEERAKLRADERELRKLALDTSGATKNFEPHGASFLDPAAVGDTQNILESDLRKYFPPKPVSPEHRKASFGISTSTEPLGKTIGTIAPGRQGLPSKTSLSLLVAKVEEGEGETGGEQEPENQETEPAAAETQEEAAEGEEQGTEGGDAARALSAAKDTSEEDELMFIWNKREAPQHRAPKVDEELARRLASLDAVEDHLRTQRAAAAAADAAHFATIGQSAQHPFGALAGGQRTSAIAAQEARTTDTVWDGARQTARWGLERDGEDLPADRAALLPLGPSALRVDEPTVRAAGLIVAHPAAAAAAAAQLRESLGPSRLEMPPDQDPHYTVATFSKTAKGAFRAGPGERDPVEPGRLEETAAVLTGFREEAAARVTAARQRRGVAREVGEKLDVPALLVRPRR
jgi:hypothetical protein